MARRQPHPLLQHVRRIAGLPEVSEESDGQLLECFVAQRDEAAFEALLERHGPMVLGACRRILQDGHDAEDAFQATYLVLCRKARSISKRASVSSWLHKVACRIALRVKAETSRQPVLDGLSLDRPAPEACPDLVWRDVRRVLDEELSQLPEKYRAPVVLHYLEGKPVAVVARELGWPVGTVMGRMARARERLRLRLMRRGLTLSMSALAAALAQPAGAGSLPVALVKSTAKVASLIILGQAAVPGAVAPKVAALAKGVLHAMLVTKLKIATGLLLAVGAVTTGAGVLTHQVLAEKQTASGPLAQAKDEKQLVQAEPLQADRREPITAHTDRYGDALPEGAVARLGTVRFNHGDGLNSLFFLPDGKTIVSEGNGSIHLWDAATGKELGHFTAAKSFFDEQTTLSPDGKTIVSLGQGSNDTLRVWDLAQRKEVRKVVLSVQRNEISVDRRNALSPDVRLAVLPMPEQIQVFDLATAKELYKLSKGGKEVRAVTFAGSDWLVTADKKQVIDVWEARTDKLVRQFLHGSPVEVLVASPDGSRLATLEHHTHAIDRLLDRDVVHVWDLTTGTQKYVPAARPKRWYMNIHFAPDGKLLFATSHGTDGNELTIWDMETGQRVREFAGTSGRAIAVSPDGKRLAAGATGKFDLWDLESGRALTYEESRHSRAAAVFLSPTADRAFTTGYASISAWDGTTGRRLHSFDLPVYPYTDPPRNYPPDGKYALSFEGDWQEVRMLVWDVAARRLLHTLRPPGASRPVASAFSPDSSLLATVYGEKDMVVVRLWDLRTGKEVRSFPETKVNWLARLFFSADRGTLFVAGKHVVGHDVASGKELFSWRMKPLKNDSGVTVAVGGRPVDMDDRIAWRTLAVSPQGTMVACILNGGFGHERVEDRVMLCEARTGRVIRRWNDSGKPSRWWEQLCFSRDGRLLASSDGENVHVWEVMTGKEIRTYRGHGGEVQSLAFSTDGRRLASASTDSTVLLWDLTLAEAEGKKPGGKEVAAWWADLAGADAARAYAAVWRLAEVREASVPFLRQRLKPVTDAEVKEIRQHIADLDNGAFAVREKAFQKLKNLGPASASALSQALEKKPSLEVRRRVEQLLEGLSNGQVPAELLRTLRALAVLEYTGTAEARHLLRVLADGANEALLTQEAKASLERLAKQTAAMP